MEREAYQSFEARNPGYRSTFPKITPASQELVEARNAEGLASIIAYIKERIRNGRGKKIANWSVVDFARNHGLGYELAKQAMAQFPASRFRTKWRRKKRNDGK